MNALEISTTQHSRVTEKQCCSKVFVSDTSAVVLSWNT